MNNQNNSSAPNSLFARKLSELENRGYEVTGRFLHKDGEYALFDGSCRWLTQPQYQRLMHEQDGSLFASQPPADCVQGGLTDEQIIQIKTECGRRYNSLWDLSDSGACEFARAILSRQSMMGGEVQGGLTAQDRSWIQAAINTLELRGHRIAATALADILARQSQEAKDKP